MNYGALTYREILDKARAGCLAIVPTGCTEQQGPHLPVDFDTWFAETMAQAAADYAQVHHAICAVVLPALPFGPTPEHRNYGSGYIHLPQALHEAVVESILVSLAEQGFRRIVVWRGCGGHDLQPVIDRFNANPHVDATVFLPDWPYHATWCRVGDPAVPGGHADSFTTSIALHLRPDVVRMEQIRNPHNLPVDWDDPQLDFAQYSSTGVIGDPTHASAELGERLWASLVPEVAAIFAQLAQTA